MAEKQCSKCGEIKPLEEFYPCRRNKSGRVAHCRECERRRHAERRRKGTAGHAKHLAHARDYYRRNTAKCKAANRRHRLKTAYGLTEEAYHTMLSSQQNACKICGKPAASNAHPSGAVAELAVDHDHATGSVRGLLCMQCNVAIGNLQHDPAICRAAAAYLEATS